MNPINEVHEKLNEAFQNNQSKSNSSESFRNKFKQKKAQIDFNGISDITFDSFTVGYRLIGLLNEEELLVTKYEWKQDFINHLNRKRPFLLRPFIKIEDVKIGHGSITLAVVVTVLTGLAALLTIIVHLVKISDWIKSYPRFN